MKENLLCKLKRLFCMGPLILLAFVATDGLLFMNRNAFSIPILIPFAVKVGCTGALVLCFLAGYISFWTMFLKHNVGTKVLRTGPYALVRHPLYAADILTIPGVVAIWLDNGIYFFGWAIIILLAHFLVLVEERYMLEKFGSEYAAYRSKVPSLIPYKGIVRL